VVAVLLKELKVPAKAIYKVVGYGRSKPLVQPPTDSRNRAVVVRFEVVG
jgi:outer membrane protein OmpA-like peptidoglycan-associated protein